MLTPTDKYQIEQLKHKLILNCPKCHGYGTPCECQDKFKYEIKKIVSHIPMKYRQFSLDMIDAPDTQNVTAQVKQYIDNIDKERKEGQGLYLWSHNKGTAKTALSCIVLLEALKKGYTAHFTDLDVCISEIMDGWYDQEKRRQFEEKVLEVDFLVIDDIGGMEIKTKGNKDVIATSLTTLFRKRANALLPTILTSNLDIQDIDDVFGERMYSIMFEHLKIIKCTGMDYRKNTIAYQKKKGMK